jgi:hypothetical protein
VCEPKLTDRGRNLCDLACEDLLRTGQLEKRPDSRGRHCWGTGIKRAVFYRGQSYAPVDLFQVIEPSSLSERTYFAEKSPTQARF